MADIEILDNGILIATLRGELDNHEANQHSDAYFFIHFHRTSTCDYLGFGRAWVHG